MAESDPIYINIRNYKLNFEEIGRGAFGNVYQGINKDTGEIVAAKKVKYKDSGQPINEVLSEMGRREGEILRILNGHRNIVKLLDYFDDKLSFWFIMELCNLNDLPKYMKNQAIDLNTKARIMVDVASGLAFMHGMTPPVIHRDIKAENILMKMEGKRHVAKISDFGMGKLFEADTTNLTMKSGVGTMGYMAPEFFVDGEYLRYQPGVDTFALGLLFSVILLYDKTNNDMKPMSAQIRKSGAYIHYGLEMKIAYKNKAPMPHLFGQGGERNPCVAQIREIISAMTQFHDKDRPSLQRVKMQVLESHYELTQVQDMGAELTELRLAHGDLQKDHDALQKERDRIQIELDEVKKEQVKLQSNHGILQTDHGKILIEHSKLKTDCGTLQTSLGNLRIKQGTVQAEQGKLQLDYGNLQVEHGELQTKHGKLQAGYGELENESGKLLHQNGQLLSEAGKIQSRLAAEMSTKLSHNESSIENVIIKHRPVNVADEYQAFCTNEWLDLKQFLDESFPKEPEKKKMNLLNIMMKISYETTVTKHQQITADLNVRLIHPMASADPDGQHRKPLKQEKAVKVSDHLTNSIGDHFRIWADEIDIKQLAKEIFSNLDVHDRIKSSKQLKQYIISCARLCWKMVLQRPPMAFDVTGIKEPWKPDLQEPVWGSADPKDPRSVVAAYAHPTLYHNQKLMVKGKVLLELSR